MYYRYGKCSKILNAFLFLFSKEMMFESGLFEISELLPYSEYLVELNM